MGSKITMRHKHTIVWSVLFHWTEGVMAQDFEFGRANGCSDYAAKQRMQVIRDAYGWVSFAGGRMHEAVITEAGFAAANKYEPLFDTELMAKFEAQPGRKDCKSYPNKKGRRSSRVKRCSNAKPDKAVQLQMPVAQGLESWPTICLSLMARAEEEGRIGAVHILRTLQDETRD